MKTIGSSIGSLLKKRPLSKEEEARLSKAIKTGDERALHMLIEHNLRLLANIARKEATPQLTADILFAEGYTGLWRAAEKFDSSKGFSFSTYATWWIKRDIKIFKSRSRNPITSKSGIGGEITVLSLDTPLNGQPNGIGMSDILVCPNPGPEELVIRQSLIEQVRGILGADSRLFRVIQMRYGLDDFPPMAGEEVAIHFGVTRACISLWEIRALNRIRDQLGVVLE